GDEVDGQIIHTSDGRRVMIGVYPISIDVDEVAAIAQRDGVAEDVREIRDRLGDPEIIFLGVDRLDYTKGIDLRLRSFESLLDELHAHPSRHHASVPAAVLVQVAVPGRDGVESYADERRTVEELVGHINGTHAAIGHPAVHYVRRSLTLDELIPLYMAADV